MRGYDVGFKVDRPELESQLCHTNCSTLGESLKWLKNFSYHSHFQHCTGKLDQHDKTRKRNKNKRDEIKLLLFVDDIIIYMQTQWNQRISYMN